ncbi:MAG: methionine adenosyltransferase [Sulfitobacter sp.]|nr:methionine adenosyltransferase [Sulfitobacter sp.]
MSSYVFTSESVSEGHPDKLADQISDAILDRFLAADPNAKVACETFMADNLVVVAGEFRMTPADLFKSLQAEIPELVRGVIRETGYDGTFPGIDPDICEIRLQLNTQSDDIHQGVEQEEGVIGAGDQGMVFGYATDETPELMPLPLLLAQRLVQRQAELRGSGEIPWLRPDAKSQVSVRYVDEQPVAVETVVLSTQHAVDVGIETVREVVEEAIVRPVVPDALRALNFSVLVNPTGRFVVGGPKGDTGLTGRKIIVDTYGGRCAHGGGAFSGKDPTKVDRSAAYMARYVAKNIVTAGMARRCTVQLAYAIGVVKPVSIHVDLHGTGRVSEENAEQWVGQIFDLTPAGIIRTLELRRPIYRKTAAYGHFGRELPEFTWERTDRAKEIRNRMLNVLNQGRLSRFMTELNLEDGPSEEMRKWWINRY